VFTQAVQQARSYKKEQLSTEVHKMNMQTIKASVLKFVKDEDGLTMVEYAVAGGLVTLAAVAAFTLLGTNIGTRINLLATCVGSGVCTTPAS
jgi:pilus assembly protein Flp/PilA